MLFMPRVCCNSGCCNGAMAATSDTFAPMVK